MHALPPEESGGVELVTAELARDLTALGHQVAVLAQSAASHRPLGLSFEEAGGVSRAWLRLPPPDDPLRAFWDCRESLPAFVEFLDRFAPEVVLIQHLVRWTPQLVDTAKARGIAVVLALHDFHVVCHRLYLLDDHGARCPGPAQGLRCRPCLAPLGGADIAAARFDRMARAVAHADLVIAPSAAHSRRIASILPFLRGRIRVVEPGIGLPPTDSRMIRARRLATAGPLRLLFLGTMVPHKGLDLLLDALAPMDPATWILEVRGRRVDGFTAWADALRERTRALPVAWAGPFDGTDRDRVLAGADVLVLPSRCDESYSRVVREARAAGLAVIASASGGPVDALTNGEDALLVPPDDGPALAAAIRRLVADRALASALGRAPARSPLHPVGADGMAAALLATLDGAGHTESLAGDVMCVIRSNGADADRVDATLRTLAEQDARARIAEIRLEPARLRGSPPEPSVPGATLAGARAEDPARSCPARIDKLLVLRAGVRAESSKWLGELLAVLDDDPLAAGACPTLLPLRPDHGPTRRALGLGATSAARAGTRPISLHPGARSDTDPDPANRPDQSGESWLGVAAHAVVLRVAAACGSIGDPAPLDRTWLEATLAAGWRVRLAATAVARCEIRRSLVECAQAGARMGQRLPPLRIRQVPAAALAALRKAARAAHEAWTTSAVPGDARPADDLRLRARLDAPRAVAETLAMAVGEVAARRRLVS